MTTKEKPNGVSKDVEWVKRFLVVITFFVLAFLVIGEFVYPDERDVVSTDSRIYAPEWQRVMDNGEIIPVGESKKVPAEHGEVVTLTATLPENIYNGEVLCFRTVWQTITVLVDGQVRAVYNTEDSRPFGINSTTRYVFVELYEEDEGKQLTYQFSSKSKYAGSIFEVYFGDRANVWLHLLQKSGTRIVVAIFLLLLSVFCLVVCGVLKVVYKKMLPLNYLAWTIFFCALWMTSETEFRQIIFKNVSILSSCTYWSLMIIPIPLMLYINEVQKGHYKKVFFIPLLCSGVTFVVTTLLQVFDIVQFVRTLTFMHICIAIAISCIVVTILMDVFKRRISDYVYVAVGVCGMITSAVLEIVVYYMGSKLAIGTVLAIGLLFLLIMAIIATGKDLLQSEQNRQQAIIAREAQAKFLANMSHEIRTPINAIIGMNEMVLRENKSDAIRQYSLNIQSASNMLLGLVNDVLDFSKIESGKLDLVEETYSLVSLIQDEVLLLNVRIAGKPISAKVEVDSEAPMKLLGDELRMKQVITNLLSNAVKYTKEGSITFKVESKTLDEERIWVNFTVKDTGIGIREEDLSKLFDSFKRLELKKNRNIEGTGLGLNIAKQLVDLMQGEIVVESEYGKGSSFTVSIPQKVVDKHPIGNFEDALREYRKENKAPSASFVAPEAKILIVDDNAVNLSLVKGLLKRTKMQVDTVASGKKCLEVTKDKSYDIILMDHMMPELDGVETLHLLREDEGNPNQNAIIVALTANAIAGCKEMYLGYGFNDYFSKPIQGDKLEELIVRYLPKKMVQMSETIS